MVKFCEMFGSAVDILWRGGGGCWGDERGGRRREGRRGDGDESRVYDRLLSPDEGDLYYLNPCLVYSY